MFWRLMVHGIDFVELGLKQYQARAALSEQRLIRKLALRHGLQLVPNPTPIKVPG